MKQWDGRDNRDFAIPAGLDRASTLGIHSRFPAHAWSRPVSLDYLIEQWFVSRTPKAETPVGITTRSYGSILDFEEQ
jgi:hypothetical protein